ncbi:myb-binding protein 1A isoform X2 [Protopterus annectens]|nr:myb-binding protein 1A isoform X2 [Protopterus annectens]
MDRILPPLGLDLLRLSLNEGTFELFWKEIVEKGLLLDKAAPCSFMCYRLLGAALPHLSLSELKMVLHGEVMLHYGKNVIATQLPGRVKFGPEMETYVDAFLENCDDPDKQLTVMKAFSTLTNQGNPVITSSWKVVRHLQSTALLDYVDYLKQMFLNPDLEICLELYTRRQNPEKILQPEQCIFRLRKWIVSRLASIIDNPWLKKDEDLVMDITRFIFFYSFFEALKPTLDIPETECLLQVPLDEDTRSATADSFFSLLNYLNCLPVLGENPEAANLNKKHVQGVTADGQLWIYCVSQYASALLSRKKYVRAVKPFTDEEREAWERMLQCVDELRKKGDKSQNMKLSAFQRLGLLIGIHLFKAPTESLELLKDFHHCMDKVLEKECKKKKKSADDEEEPEWIEVVVEILLSLLSQQSKFIRQACTSVFKQICSNVTEKALHLILDVLDPEKDHDEDRALLITDEGKKAKRTSSESESEDNSDEEKSSEEEDEDDNDDSSDNEDKEGDEREGDSAEELEENDSESETEPVDENFRMGLIKALQAGNALPREDEASDEEDLDDEAMMSLDENLAALFAEQKKRAQAKKDEKDQQRKEKILVRDFKIKVLDLIDVFLKKQPENPLVFGIIEPLIAVIEQTMTGKSDQQEQDFLQKTADIFINQLCKSKRYCKDVSSFKDKLYDMMERLVKRARKQTDSSVALYCFSASLYIFRVLRGNISEVPVPPVVQSKKKHKDDEQRDDQEQQGIPVGDLDIDRVKAIYQEALTEFMTKRNSALTGAMFVDLFVRFPIICLHLLDSTVSFITEGVRQHQQGQACLLVQKALQIRELRQSMTESELETLLKQVLSQIHKSLKTVNGFKVKVDQEKVLKCLELTSWVAKIIKQQKLNIELTNMVPDLLAMAQMEGFGRSVQLDNVYWNIMRPLGYSRPKKAKKQQPLVTESTESTKKKKKGFLPETKKRKNRKKVSVGQQKEITGSSNEQSGEGHRGKKKKNRKRKISESGDKNGLGHSSPAKQNKVQSENTNKGKDRTETDKSKKKKHKKREHSE